ncbi:uncharacterized protein PFLUO_LOCUS8571 [Penicillium psychrofluorescens]|uniref:uncharacterized protein n=1 Tax=Penicillium psychrofluorescens TaxID=3158075 RepID=UPI003CCE2F99
MASIKSLLNPLPEIPQFSPPAPLLARTQRPVSSSPPLEKRQKLAKDAPIFTRGRIRGELRYPPCEERDVELERIQSEFKLHPTMGSIAEFPRHIPYSSDKKSFQQLTGRESFEVFQYTFQMPGEEKVWTVMWDYNIGLTTPGKMINSNPGLKDICHSITGGALAAQGYWMPFEAAKAISATFCWKIRYALTPLFGSDFPSLCIPPEDSSRFGRMIIDQAIVKRATEIANYYRSLALQSVPRPSTETSQSRPVTPYIRRDEHPSHYPARAEMSMLRRHIMPRPTNSRYAGSISSEYGSSSEVSDRYCVSPGSPVRNAFTPVNIPRTSDFVPRSQHISPMEVLASLQSKHQKMLPSAISEDESETDASWSNLYSEVSRTPTDWQSPDVDTALEIKGASAEDADESASSDFTSLDGGGSLYDDGDADYLNPSVDKATTSKACTDQSDVRTVTTRASGCVAPTSFAREVKAAHALLHLHMQEAMASDTDAEAPSDLGRDAVLLFNAPTSAF